jgi:predicted ArsR family transcriptional regulator
MPVTTARQKVLVYLRKNRLASAQEIARALRVTPANIRHHLGILAADGRVAVLSERSEGRGRPVKLYGLSGVLTGDNLAMLSDVVLEEALKNPPAAGREAWLESLAAALMEQAGLAELSALPLSKRLALAVEKLNELHYAARWEAGAEGPRLLFGQCPYAAIIDRHPELCRMDAALAEAVLGWDVQQTARIHPGAGTVSYCVFV